jgi:hypothetical protein
LASDEVHSNLGADAVVFAKTSVHPRKTRHFAPGPVPSAEHCRAEMSQFLLNPQHDLPARPATREKRGTANYTGVMAVLHFPTPEILRLVLANGVVPRTLSDRPANGSWDAKGRPWIRPDQLVGKETIAQLGRLGVRWLAAEGAPTSPIGCWAELLPLQRVQEPSGPVLFTMPDSMLPALAAECRRLGVPCRPQLLESTAAILCDAAPASMLLRAENDWSGVAAFVEQSPNRWVRRGWRHPLPEHLGAAPDRTLLVNPPRSVTVVSTAIRTLSWEELPVAGVNARPGATSPRVRPETHVRFRLLPRSKSPRELAWVFPGEAAARFREFCAGANERLLRQFEVAHTNQGGIPRVIVRPSPDLRIPPFLPLAADGYYRDPRLPDLHIPSRRSLHPVLRVREAATLFELSASRFTWLESGPSGVVQPFAVPVESFRPVAALIEYRPQRESRLRGEPPSPAPFAFAKFATVAPVEERYVELDEPPLRDRRAGLNDPVFTDDRPSWFARSVTRLLNQFRRNESKENSPVFEPQKAGKPAPRGSGTARRLTEKLSSPAALVHGQDRAARRHQLEARLLGDLPKLDPEHRAAGWTELAEVYAATGNPADAAICWINAIWDTPSPPGVWLDQWLLAECRSAKQSTPVPSLDRWLGEPGRFGAGRVVAAYAVMGAHQKTPPADLVAALPRVIAFLDQHFDDLPARAAWLSRLALTHLCSGDALGLARWRDRILARLREKGPGLDLDEPSFLRFHGTASPDRFQTAREWLVNSHKPIVEWVSKLASGGSLQYVGLDSEAHCTKAYAELMLAWGLGCLGERTRSRDWTAKARKALGRPPGANCDAAVHPILADAFTDRIRDVQDGRVPKPGLTPELRGRVDQLTDANLGRYTVDKLRRHSRILEPAGAGRDYGGLNLRAFRGYDLLGERLQLLADRSDPAILAEEAKPILALCSASPASTNVPRVALTLLDLAPQLDSSLVASVLSLAEPAASWMEAWFDSLSWGDATTSAKLPGYLARLLHASFAAAAWFNHWPAVRPLVDLLVKRAGSDPALRNAMLLGAGSLFRSLRKLGYREEAEALLNRIDPGRGEWPADAPTLPPAQFGLAIGWFAVGDEDAGNRILDDARNRLFVARSGQERDRTELAIAYAEALGFAPPRIALGRLEELFQLEQVPVEGLTNRYFKVNPLLRPSTIGSTNRYFTLKPLQLIDAVVRSVVTDDFALGPAVRGWLDDDEFLIRRRIHKDMSDVLRGTGME